MTRLAACLAVLFPFLMTGVAAKYPEEFSKAYKTYTELAAQEKFGEAIPHAKKALDIALTSEAFNDNTRGMLAFNLGYANFQDLRLGDAAEAFGTAIVHMEKSAGADRNLIGEALVYRGICYRSLLRPHLAKEDLKKALSLLTADTVGAQIVRADALENLAWVMIQLTEEDAAREYSSQAVAVYSRLLPKNHPRLLRVRVLVAATIWLDGERSKARDVLASAIADAEKAGVAAEGQAAQTESGQFNLRELIRFHREVANLYELMKRDKDAEYHDKVASDLGKGIKPAALRVKPLDRPPPRYPRRASDQGKIGWVILQFTVGKDGVPRDIEVVDAAPEGYFEDAAVSAAKRWKYEPPMEDGKPVEVPRIRTTIQFMLENRR